MFLSALLSLYRSLSRHKSYTVLNIGGLAIGIAVALLLFVTVRFESGYDRWLPAAADIYRVNVQFEPADAPPRLEATSAGITMPILQSAFPGITAATRVKPENVSVIQDGRGSKEALRLVDPEFFEVFDLPLAEGSRETALQGTAQLLISETIADKYFQDGSAVGKTLTVAIQGQPRDFTISGILRDLPSDSSLRFDMVSLLSPALYNATNQAQIFDDWDSLTVYTYLRLDGEGVREAVSADLDRFARERVTGLNANATRFTLVSLPDIHFFDGQNALPAEVPGVDPVVIGGLALVGGLLLVIASINYVNLATARAVLRSREVAMRKVLGASRRALFIQFMTESVATAIVAGVIGLALAELLMPLLNVLQGSDLDIEYVGRDGVVLPLVAVVLLIGLASGLYPAVVLSRFSAASVLGASRSAGGGRTGARVRQILVTVQFAAAIALTICATIMTDQARYMRSADVGFERDGLILLPSFADDEVSGSRTSILEAIRRTPGVVSAGVSSRAPASENTTSTTASRPGSTAPETQVELELVGPDYFETYDFRLASGRFLGPDQRLDDFGNLEEIAGRNVMLNATAARALGFESPDAAAGEQLSFGGGTVSVVGVVADARFRAPEEAVPPIIYVYTTEAVSNPVAAVRYSGQSPASILSSLEQVWTASAAGTPFTGVTANESMSAFYLAHEKRGRLFAAGALVALFIGSVGLYGLAAFTTDRRTREIGIRKVLGASNRDILSLLLRQFLVPVAASVVIAWPFAFIAMQAWLDQFDQRVGMNLWFFLAGAVVAVLIALGTILHQALRAARRSPAESLRVE